MGTVRGSTTSYGPSSAAALNDGYAKGEPSPDPSKGPMTDTEWLQSARDAWESSRDWFDSSIRRQLEDNLRAFNSKHPSGSKYSHESYQRRSNLFRPATRTAMRKLEAAAATAFFSTSDVVACEAVNKADKEQVLAAKVKEALLKYRLNSRGSIPWFMICQGAFQQSAVEGVVISKQSWRYEEDEDGNITVDRPDISLIANENFRINPACDWSDPIGTSPYLIHLVPYHVVDVKRRVSESGSDKTGRPEWRKMSEALITTAIRHEWDSVRQAREDNRVDRYENANAIADYEIVWIHHHIMRREDGKDWVFDTLGTEHLLSDPVPLDEYYPLGFRPYVMGYSVIEAHKPYPAGPVEIGLPLQHETNETANAHLDNIKLGTNKRYFIKRGASTDIHSLMRNTPGSIVYTTNPKEDIQEITPPPLSRDMFEERNRLKAEFNEALGVYEGPQQGSARKWDDKVGVEQLLSDTASSVTELTIKTFGKTWAEPVLQQTDAFISAFEEDQRVLGLIGASFGTDALGVVKALGADTEVKVRVGFGATNPAKRIEKMTLAAQTTLALVPEAASKMDPTAIIQEVWGAAGFPDASIFFPFMGQDEDPQIVQLTQQVEELQQELETKSYEWQFKIQIAQLNNEAKVQIEQMKGVNAQQMQQGTHRFQAWLEEQKLKMFQLDWQISRAKSEIEERSMRLQREALSNSISMAERQFSFMIYQWEQEQRKEMVTRTPVLEGTSNVIDMIPQDSRGLMTALRNPPSGEPVNLPGHDKAGVLGRNDYGQVPFAGG